ncbi:MAG: aminopeptidase P family protein [Chloroflexi bacterium]|nr:aminopeptidase P family protein [Chloroflexota bacterium]
MPISSASTPASVHAERLIRLRAELAPGDVDALLVSQPESRFYLSGYTGHDLPPRDSAGYLLIGSDFALLLTDPRTSEQAALEASDYTVVRYPSGQQGAQVLAQSAAERGVQRLGFEAVHLPYAIYASLGGHLEQTPVELVPTSGLVDRLRIVKDAAEQRLLQHAVDVVDDCLADLYPRLAPGLTERQVARMIETYFFDHADGPSFPSIVASGPNGSMPHAVPSERPIEAGEGITIDIGALAAGYCSDQTRTICLGRARDPRLREIYGLVLEAQLLVEERLRPGMTGREADALARDHLAQAGYGDAFMHSLGHGVGLEVHEPPTLSRLRGDEPLLPGMVFSVEPGVYLPGWGGVRIEDLVLLEDSGARVLCRAPKDLEL